jgi:hypothetical protein
MFPRSVADAIKEAKQMQRKPTKAVVLFEDDPTLLRTRKAQLEKAFGKVVPITPFESNVLLAGGPDVPLEQKLASTLESARFHHGVIGLIVCDMALERYGASQATSSTVVSAAAEALGVPICLYEAGDKGPLFSLDRRRKWGKGLIIVDENSESFGRECAGLYHGFCHIERELAKIPAKDFAKSMPAEILARILEKPEETDRIALYGAGEQSPLSELLPYYDARRRNILELRKRFHRALGNWLYTSILRFPGIAVNEIAAASYLNISRKDFDRPGVQSIFSKAAYRGPFFECGRWWWRRGLDAMLAAARCRTGLEYAGKRGMKGLKPSACSEGSRPHAAGYYCMITEAPVCEEHSRGGISWFPGGADLARVSRRQYEKMGPFMGLY